MIRYSPGIYMIKNRYLDTDFEYYLDNQRYICDGDLVLLVVAHNNLRAEPNNTHTFVHQVGTVPLSVISASGFPGT